MFKFYEIVNYGQLKGFSRAAWSLCPMERLVKVTSLASNFTYVNPLRPPDKIGYVTQECFIIGKTPYQIERDLGLSPFELKHGAIVFALERLPRDDEFEFRFLATMPGGKDFESAQAENHILQSRLMTNRYFQKVYPPGAPIPQWEVSALIPLRPLRQLVYGQTYQIPDY